MLWFVLSSTATRGKMLNMLRGMYASIKTCQEQWSELMDHFESLYGQKQCCL